MDFRNYIIIFELDENEHEKNTISIDPSHLIAMSI